MHIPTAIAARNHRCERVESHSICRPGQDEHRPLGAGSGVPDPDGVIRTSGDDPGAVGTHRAIIHSVGVTGEGDPFDTRLDVPDPEGVVIAGRDDPGAVGAHRNPVTKALWPVSVIRSAPVAASQILKVSSPPADTIHLPSGLTAQLDTTSLWPMRAARSAPSAASRS